MTAGRWVVKLGDKYLGLTLSRVWTARADALTYANPEDARGASGVYRGSRVVRLVPKRRPSEAYVAALERVAKSALRLSGKVARLSANKISGEDLFGAWCMLDELLKELDEARRAGGGG